jgi:hypothetical protein
MSEEKKHILPVFNKCKKLGVFVHKETKLVMRSFKDKNIIGKLVNKQIIPLTSEDKEVCKIWNFMYEEDNKTSPYYLLAKKILKFYTECKNTSYEPDIIVIPVKRIDTIDIPEMLLYIYRAPKQKMTILLEVEYDNLLIDNLTDNNLIYEQEELENPTINSVITILDKMLSPLKTLKFCKFHNILGCKDDHSVSDGVFDFLCPIETIKLTFGDCIVCHDKTEGIIHCCNTYICMECLAHIKTHSQECCNDGRVLKCPHCRKRHGISWRWAPNYDSFTKDYRFKEREHECDEDIEIIIQD